MHELNEHLEAVLADCLRAMDRGATADECLARYPDEADELRPLLELRSQLGETDVPEPSPAAYERGRQALLGRLAAPGVVPASGALLGGLRAAFARGAAVLAAVAVIGAGAIGVSAAGGFQPARDVLETLRIIEDEPSDRGPDRPSDRPDDQEPSDRPAADSTEPGRPDDAPKRPTAEPTPVHDRPVDPAPTEEQPVDDRPADGSPTEHPPVDVPARPTTTPGPPADRPPVDVVPVDPPATHPDGPREGVAR